MPTKNNPINKVAVIGAGVMGSGIAAQVANAGVEVLLLDIVPQGAKDRSVIAKGALAKMAKTNPAPLMHKKCAALITPGNIEDDIKQLKTCDWIIEVVIERLDIKHSIYKQIQANRKKGSVVSSNTSTIPLTDLVKGMPADFKNDFLITHFFNPPRYMRLLEVVTGKDTAANQTARVSEFADHKLGKSIVGCHDRPGFIANRIGTFWLQASVTEALQQKISVEAADSVLSRPIGVPKTGVFALLDLVGLDLMPHIISSLSNTLPKGDMFHELAGAPKLLEKLIAEGYTGRKGKGGFYRLNTSTGGKIKEVLNLQTGEYSKAVRPTPAATKVAKRGGLKALLTHNSAEGRYAWSVMADTLAYAAHLVPEIADDIEAVDRAMCLGYNWKFGPFELIDKLGSAWFAERLHLTGRKVPKLLEMAAGRKFYKTINGVQHYLSTTGEYVPVTRAEGVLLLQDIKRASKPIFSNNSASLWDIGDGVACLEFHSKMNSLNPFIMALIERTVRELPARGYKGLVIHNEGTHFSVGANIAMLLVSSTLHMWKAIDWILHRGQQAYQHLKFAPFPVVGAPSGMALGGGCEILLHCDAIEAHAETYAGLVEAGVGIVPGWGGCKEFLGRWSVDKKRKGGPMFPVMQAFQAIATAQVAKSAMEAQDMLILRKTDNVVMNRDRVLAAAKARVLAMAPTYSPPAPYEFKLPGKSGKAALMLAVRDFVAKGMATPHDVTIAGELATVLTGGDVHYAMDTLTEQDILDLERKALIDLTKTKPTRDRVMHMLRRGKPLRN